MATGKHFESGDLAKEPALKDLQSKDEIVAETDEEPSQELSRLTPVQCPDCTAICETMYDFKQHVAYWHVHDRCPVALEVPKLCPSWRMLVTFLCTCCLTLVFANGSSMASAMVCMVRDIPPETPSDTSVLLSPANSSTKAAVTFDWDKTKQRWIRSVFFVGSLFGILPSGILTTRSGGKHGVIIGLLFSSAGQLITPVAALAGDLVLCIARVITGFTSGLLYPAVFAVLALWVPPGESSLLFGLAGTGMEIGAFLSFTLSTLGCDVLGSEWSVTFYVLDLPCTHGRIDAVEIVYIETAVEEAGGIGFLRKDDNSPLVTQLPLMSMLKSPPVWAIMVSQFGTTWLYYQQVNVEPRFMREVLKIDEATIKLLMTLPLLTVLSSVYVAGTLADFFRRRRLSTTSTRKLADFIGKLFPGAIVMAYASLQPGDEAQYIALFFFKTIAQAFCHASWVTNPVDLAPAYTALITAVCETCVMCLGVVTPLVIDILTPDNSQQQWSFVLYTAGSLQLATFFFYLTYGSSELQPWGRVPKPTVKPKVPPKSGDEHPGHGSGAADQKRRHKRRRFQHATQNSSQSTDNSFGLSELLNMPEVTKVTEIDTASGTTMEMSAETLKICEYCEESSA
ncbi:hypothetical protein BaRGS_00006962 [Batillaria attramentaria]|uniref:Major facilitator superfamily (MFS) profile domain-containing protein n=1 Tax=Batillaria attramentaria TaxID=370345 RepID=A0ABD0LRT6_9CAEN